MRILGKGQTALSIKEIYSDAVLYDDSDKQRYDFSSDEITVVSPGIPPHNELVQNTKNIISEYDLFYKEMPFSIWISGTNGKTTTTQMLQHLLEDKGSVCGGNIGTPLAKLSRDAKIWILETSSFTLHYTRKTKPNIYILLPISDDHVSWHGSFEEYEQSKLNPLDNMTNEDTAIIPIKYKEYKSNANIIYYEKSEDLEKYFKLDRKRINFKEPFLMDALLALAAEKLLFQEVNYTLINSFVQDPHKLEEFCDRQNRLWVDDSKATNLDATIQAVKTYKDKKMYLILGGDDKGADLNPLFEELCRYDLNIFLIGKNTEKLYEISNKYNIKSIKCYDLEKAVSLISVLENADKSSVGLLSPAAASLDQFSSYKERGERFKEFVNSL
ncbi:MAG: UDP-N-acetylmuramoyl-L-alanine--D-glutamate ligase [Arcobacteraceae bacterium]